MKSDLVDFKLALHHRTPAAVLVSDTGEEAKAIWLPLCAIEVHDTGKTVRCVTKTGRPLTLPLVEVTMKERLAIDKRLI